MITGVIYITKHDGAKDIMTFPSVWQAEYYLHLKAKLGSMVWYEA